jgi:hypothetical protein
LQRHQVIYCQRWQLALQLQQHYVTPQQRVLPQRQRQQAAHAADGWRQHVQPVAAERELRQLDQRAAAAGQVFQLVVLQQETLQ